ncbi:MAG: hypothetical protein ACE5IR_05500 [bacterium]
MNHRIMEVKSIQHSSGWLQLTDAAKTCLLMLTVISIFFMSITAVAKAQEVSPVLEFPHVGLDDTSTYRGYTTRFFRDSAANTLQIYINQNDGRVVHVWADAANESIAFTARDAAGRPAKLEWDSLGAEMSSAGKTRYVHYTLSSKTSVLDVGLFVLSTMRLERDFQYLKRHTLAFDSEPFIMQELTGLIDNLARLPAEVRERHLALLHAQNPQELRSRLVPHTKRQSPSHVLVEQPTFDGENHLSLEIKVNSKLAALEVAGDKISLRSLQRQPIKLFIKVGTDSPALTPLRSDDIFNDDFFRFYERAKSERLQRQVKSMELLSSQEKLMAGLPNYGTYFGRDMMMSALMLEPVLKPAMLEHVISSVLRKLLPHGEVSHEEGLGGQAIRENAARYNRLIADYFQQKTRGDVAAANKILDDTEKILANLQATTENYNMVDDDFQLPVLTARYLASPDISDDRKREFLQSAIRPGDETSQLSLLLRNFVYVSKVSRAYVENPVSENLVSFRKLASGRWHAGSWRDSAVGYANGRYAMDINTIWVPKALESIEKIFVTLRELGFSIENLQQRDPELRETKLFEYARHPASLLEAVKTWRGAVRGFEVHLSPQEVQQRVRAKLSWLPEEERFYWQKIIENRGADNVNLDFLAISLDEKGQPIPVVHTDVATWLFLENVTEQILKGHMKREDVLKRLRTIFVSYPVGLFLEGVGPVVANDVYASPEVWESFKRDLYHSPRVVWGREVNLLFLGLAKQILAAYDSQGRLKDAGLDSYVKTMRAFLDQTRAAVEASGLKHNELWSYRILGPRLLPARYATTTDIQLWNLTDLAVQYVLERESRNE